MSFLKLTPNTFGKDTARSSGSVNPLEVVLDAAEETLGILVDELRNELDNVLMSGDDKEGVLEAITTWRDDDAVFAGIPPTNGLSFSMFQYEFGTHKEPAHPVMRTVLKRVHPSLEADFQKRVLRKLAGVR